MCYLPKDHYKDKGEWTIDFKDHEEELVVDEFDMKVTQCKNCKIKKYPLD